jgi:predicted signal transduction protein with EAL and GGDEF domain
VARATDTVARLGGDEFAILMPDVTEDDALAVARRALQALRDPFTVGDLAVWAGASIGVCFGRRGQSADLLLRYADTALYTAKAHGRGNVQVFRPQMQHAARDRLQVASELGVAITQRQLRVHYQPIVQFSGGLVIGVEALVRWMHPRRGLLLPGEFLAVAQDSRHIVALGRWMLHTAIGQLAAWREYLPGSAFQLHVNLSPVELRWPGLTDFVRDTLLQHAVAADRLALEVSETALMTDDVGALEALHTLRNWGVGIEIDDFGTGYSPIGYLRRLPIDTVKVHQSLIRDITTDRQQAEFVGAILRLIEAAGLRAVAEGIQTAGQLTQLHRMGCSYGQGPLFGAPLPAHRMTGLLAGRPVRTRR